VAASWTIEAEEDGHPLYRPAVAYYLVICGRRDCGPACAARAVEAERRR